MLTQFAQKRKGNIAKFHIATKMASLVALLLVIPMGLVKPQHYESKITLTDKSENPIALAEKTISVISVPSRDEVEDASFGLDPEAIKALMQEIGTEYNIDWKFVYAIGYLESGNYSSHLARNQFNFFGRKANSSSWMSYSDPEEAIRNQYDYLQTRYFDRGLDTPYEIGPIYCEGNTWAGKVTTIMNTL